MKVKLKLKSFNLFPGALECRLSTHGFDESVGLLLFVNAAFIAVFFQVNGVVMQLARLQLIQVLIFFLSSGNIMATILFLKKQVF